MTAGEEYHAGQTHRYSSSGSTTNNWGWLRSRTVHGCANLSNPAIFGRVARKLEALGRQDDARYLYRYQGSIQTVGEQFSPHHPPFTLWQWSGTKEPAGYVDLYTLVWRLVGRILRNQDIGRPIGLACHSWSSMCVVDDPPPAARLPQYINFPDKPTLLSVEPTSFLCQHFKACRSTHANYFRQRRRSSISAVEFIITALVQKRIRTLRPRDLHWIVLVPSSCKVYTISIFDRRL